MAEAIKVAIRVRPINDREKALAGASGTKIVIKMKEQTCCVLPCASLAKQKDFTYDYCYDSIDENSKQFKSQEAVFADIGKLILCNAYEGFNGTLFTYGQTGSGKTHTLMGPPDDAGIIPRAVACLFHWRDAAEPTLKKGDKVRVLKDSRTNGAVATVVDPNWQGLVKVEMDEADEKGNIKSYLQADLENIQERETQIKISYLEIYKEMVTDLLVPGNEKGADLRIMEHPKLGVYVKGLLEPPSEHMEDVMTMLRYGMQKRVTAATSMNATSSRSHAVFTIHLCLLDGPKPKPGEPDERKCLSSKVNLIDLAGSERSKKAGTSGDTQKEGSAINMSLSSLGRCIKALSESANKSGSIMVPFRESKLTFLLKDSLAGNSKTFMLAAVSPVEDNVDETISTLRFASSVKSIQTVAVKNKDKKDELIENMEDEIRALRAQVMAGGPDVAEARDVLFERSRLKEEMHKEFHEEVAAAKTMQEARNATLEEGGLSASHVTQAFGIDEKTPYLLNMADDPMLAGCLIYLIKTDEDTLVGAHKDNTITLRGLGIPDHLCHIKNEGNTKTTLQCDSEQGRVVVNGKKVPTGQKRELHNGDHIFLGRAHALKLIMPEDEDFHKTTETELNDLSLHGLEDEYAALDDSDSFQSLDHLLPSVLKQMESSSGKAAADNLLKEMKKACQYCDEANELTSECRPNESLHFEVDITSSWPHCGLIRALTCNLPRDQWEEHADDENMWETKYLWTVKQLVERVDRMRDFCASAKDTGQSVEVDDFEDPWNEMDQVELAQKVRRLESNSEEANVRVVQEHMWQLKTLMTVRRAFGWSIDKTSLQLYVRAWAMLASQKSLSRKSFGAASWRSSGASQASAASAVSDMDYEPESTFERSEPRRRTSTGASTLFSMSNLKTDKSAPNGVEAAKRRQTMKQAKMFLDAESEEKREEMTFSRAVSTGTTTSAGSKKMLTFGPDASPISPPRRGTIDEFNDEEDKAPEVAGNEARQNEAAVVQRDESAERENADLRRQVHDLKKQMEVAWETCSILKDYARHLQSQPPPIVPSSPSGPSRAFSASEGSSSPPRPIMQLNTGSVGSASSYASSPTRMRALMKPVLDYSGAVLDGPGRDAAFAASLLPVPVVAIAEPVMLSPPMAALPMASYVPVAAATAHVSYVPSQAAQQALPAGFQRSASADRHAAESASLSDRWRGLGGFGPSSSRSASADDHVTKVQRGVVNAAVAHTAPVFRSVGGATVRAASPDRQMHTVTRLVSAPTHLTATGSAAIRSASPVVARPGPSIETPALTAFGSNYHWNGVGSVSSGQPSLSSFRATSANVAPHGTVTVAQHGTVTVALEPSLVMRSEGASAPTAISAPFERGDTQLLPRPLQMSSTMPASNDGSVPASPWQEASDRGRTTALEDQVSRLGQQVRLIADRIGENEGQRLSENSSVAQEGISIPQQVIDTGRYKAAPQGAFSQWSPAAQIMSMSSGSAYPASGIAKLGSSGMPGSQSKHHSG